MVATQGKSCPRSCHLMSSLCSATYGNGQLDTIFRNVARFISMSRWLSRGRQGTPPQVCPHFQPQQLTAKRMTSRLVLDPRPPRLSLKPLSIGFAPVSTPWVSLKAHRLSKENLALRLRPKIQLESSVGADYNRWRFFSYRLTPMISEMRGYARGKPGVFDQRWSNITKC